MDETKQFQEFSETISQALDLERMMADIEVFSHLNRYTGSEEGERAAEFIAGRMESLGIPVSRETYRIYRSLPGNASVRVTGAAGEKAYALTPYVYSGTAKGLTAELVYDEKSEGPCTQKEMAERLAAFKGKIVLTHESGYSFACGAKAAGALAVLTIWHANLAHHGTLGGVWGTPEPDDLFYRYPRIPFAEICHDGGEELKVLCQNSKEPVTVCLDVEMEDGILPSMMPVARVEGKSEKFVLVSGHYDSWYEGVTDNGVANAAMMEMARVFKENQEKLGRTVVFAWWSGHSDGRYSGSAWYYDNHWMELKKNCVAHINMDICGCKGSDLVGFNTSMLEGAAFDREFLLEFNDEEPIAPVPMARFADQTFWGADIPFAIMPKFSKKNPGKTPFFWWHSVEDTLDKVDPQIVLRDAKVVAKLSAIFANIPRLPADMTGFLAIMRKRLMALEEELSAEFCLKPVYPYLDRLEGVLKEVEEILAEKEACREDTDDAVIKISGELVRLVYTEASPYHQDPAVEYGLFPALSRAAGLSADNTEAAYYLAVQTNFIRQRNRLEGQLSAVLEVCENLLYRWKNGEL